jgi:hypothetical protein
MAISVKYQIQVEKDGEDIKVTYDLSLPVGEVALIADFKLYVEGTNLIKNFSPGQQAFNGAEFHKLTNPEKDATVSFAISSNQGWTASSTSKLRGSKRYDDVLFAS